MGRRALRGTALCRRKAVHLCLAYVCVALFLTCIMFLPRMQPQTDGLPDPNRLSDPCKARLSGSQHVDYILYRRHHGASRLDSLGRSGSACGCAITRARLACKPHSASAPPRPRLAPRSALFKFYGVLHFRSTCVCPSERAPCLGHGRLSALAQHLKRLPRSRRVRARQPRSMQRSDTSFHRK